MSEFLGHNAATTVDVTRLVLNYGQLLGALTLHLSLHVSYRFFRMILSGKPPRQRLEGRF